MDVPLALKDVGIRHGLMGYKRKSSAYCHQTDAVGLSALFTMTTMGITNYICQSFLVKVERKRRFVHYLLEIAL